MKKFLIAGSSLAAVGAAGAAGAVDVTLGGSIDMGVEFGVGKNQGSLAIGDAYNSVSLSLAAAGTTDGGMRYGGSFTLATAGELEFDYYVTDNGEKAPTKITVKNYTDLQAQAFNVSGGQAIDADDIVAVKINSSWHSVSNNTRTILVPDFPGISSSAICKVAGRAHDHTANNAVADDTADAGFLAFARSSADGNKIVDLAFIGSDTPTVLGFNEDTDAVQDGYLPAGRVTQLAGAAARSVGLLLTAGSGALNSGKVKVFGSNLGEAAKDAGDALNDKFTVALSDGDKDGFYNVGDEDDVVVASAAVFAGPYAEVKLQSSSTKMVIGAVCVSGNEASDANFFMNNASKVVTASDASIYIEGGFGKLTLQTGDYAGAVSAIGDAGDQADIGANGLVAVVEGVGLLGANPYLAVDLAKGTSLNSLEVLTGGTIDMGGLSAAVDVELGQANNGTLGIDAWDLGLSYAMGDMAVNFVVDSANDWGMSAAMDVAGFGVSATIYNKAAEDHKKSGLFYDVSASTSLNGFGLSLGVDQDLQPTASLSKSMGGLSIYAGYDAGDEGGKVGATLSF